MTKTATYTTTATDAGRMTYTSRSGHVHIVVDAAEEEFYIEAHDDRESTELVETVSALNFLGFELLDDDECLPTRYEARRVTRWYMVTEPWADAA